MKEVEEKEKEGSCPGHSVRNSTGGQEVARHVCFPFTPNSSQLHAGALCFSLSITAYSFFPGGSDDKRIHLLMQDTRVRSLGQEGPLEKEMENHSSILAWRIPWTREPGGLQPAGLRRVGPN